MSEEGERAGGAQGSVATRISIAVAGCNILLSPRQVDLGFCRIGRDKGELYRG